MFCYQCEQTAHGTGCEERGVCGKDPQTAAMQDLLIYVTKGVSMYAHRAAQLGVRDQDIDIFVFRALFVTVTNVNFDALRIARWVKDAVAMREKAKALYENACKDAGKQPETLAGPAAWQYIDQIDELVRQGELVSVRTRMDRFGDDLAGLQELLIYGLKGLAAYGTHAYVLGKSDPALFAFTHEALDFTTNPSPTVDELLGMNLRCGEMSVNVLALLDSANTGAYGNPVPTPVLMGHKKGKAILVSGHDLKDLEELLKQTEGKGINIYTHGEMLPAHGYPELKKYPHLVGHFGGAWMRQKSEFKQFPGAILMTTNCIMEPQPEYKDQLFTSGVVGWKDIPHITNGDFSEVIAAAEEAPGFTDDSPEKFHYVGFGHHAVLGLADKVIDAVKQGAIKRFVLIGGCDGAEPGRNYYTDMAETMPKDWVVLTLGCGKFRVVDCEMGDIGGIPRLLDMGQCNDSYSAVRVAMALADAFQTDINSLPLSLVVSWYEQKAVCVLLALLHLGVKNIRLGPKLPAFVTPAVLNVLVEKFNIMPIGEVEADLKQMAEANA